MKLLSVSLLVIVTLAFSPMLLAEAPETPSTQPAAQAKAPQAPDFALMDQEGKLVRLSDFKGKIVVLEWINFECPFTQRHIKAGTMKSLAKEFGERGVVWLGINSTQHYDVAKNKADHKKWDLNYPVLDDHRGRVGRAYSAKTTPDMRIIGRDGTIVYSGAIDDDPQGDKPADQTTNYVRKALDELLVSLPVSTPQTKPYGCSVKYGEAPPKAPEFALKNQDGEEVRLSDLAGRIVVLEWVNPDCPYVVRHYKAGTMKTLAEEFAPQGVVWLAVNSTKYMDADASKKFKAAEGLPYDFLIDQDGKVGRLYEAKTTPDMRIIDIDGSLVYSGAIDDDPRNEKSKEDTTNYVRKALKELLAGEPVSSPQTKPYGCSVKYAE